MSRDLRVFATPDALADAERLRLDGCLENRVERAIHAGLKRRKAPAGMPELGPSERVVFIDKRGLVARLTRTRSPLTGKQAWLVVRVARLASPTRKENQ